MIYASGLMKNVLEEQFLMIQQKNLKKTTGWFYKYIYNIEIISIAVISIILFILLSYFNDSGLDVGKILNRLCFAEKNVYIFYMIFLLFYTVIVLVVMSVGEYFLGEKILKEYSNLDKDNYEKKYIFLRKTSEMIRDILEDDKKEFIKNYLNGIKKEDLINLYQFAQRHESEIGNEILNNSNMKVVIPFTTITITLILSQIAEAFKISNFAVNKSGGTDFWISILILAIMGYFLFTLVVFIFEKIEKKLFLDILMSQKKKMNNFLRYLEEVILNYDLQYDLNKSEMIDDNYENCSKIKRKLINKIKFLIRQDYVIQNLRKMML